VIIISKIHRYYGPVGIKAGLGFVKHRIDVHRHGTKKYIGNAEEICKQAVDDCWNGNFFQGSSGHFHQFWARDFGMCTQALLNQGHEAKVEKTLENVLPIYERNKHITTTIFDGSKPMDIFGYSADSLPFIVRSLRLADAQNMIKRHHSFLQAEINDYFNTILDKKRGIVRTDRNFSSAKDSGLRQSSGYNNAMVVMLSKEIDKLEIFDNPFESYNLTEIFKENFWTGEFILDDLSGYQNVSGDANSFPFWLGVMDSTDMLEKTIETVQHVGLDKPFPLKYELKRMPERENFVARNFLKDYISTTNWTQIGAVWIDTVSRVKPSLVKHYIEQYTELIERNQNYFELFYPDREVFKTPLYHADEGMLWSAMFLDILRRR
jgi:hypothetical protein